MKLVLFIIFAIGLFATSGVADPSDVAYRLALGPLEFFLKLDKRDVSVCYQDKDKAYAQSILDFSKKIKEIKNKVNKALTGRSNSKNHLTWGLQEMQYIADSLNTYLVNLKEKIFNSKLVEGGKVVWSQRPKIENHYKQYETHKTDLKNRRESHHDTFIPQMDEAFNKILDESDKLLEIVLQCCEGKVSFTKKKT